jgi:hypothetical protein
VYNKRANHQSNFCWSNGMSANTIALEQEKPIAEPKRLPSWREMNWDTTPEADAVLFKLWREAPAWRKLEIMEGLNRTARQLALMGLRQRFPDISPEELRRQFAALTLGTELAAKIYAFVSD